MPRNKENTRQLHVVMPVDGYEDLERVAAQERRAISDVVREAIQNYIAAKGKPINIDVKRGGYRESKVED